MPQSKRLIKLNEIAQKQMKLITNNRSIDKLKQLENNMI